MTKELAALVQTAIDIVKNENQRLECEVIELRKKQEETKKLQDTIKALRRQVQTYEDKLNTISTQRVLAYECVMKWLDCEVEYDKDKIKEFCEIMVGFKEV